MTDLQILNWLLSSENLALALSLIANVLLWRRVCSLEADMLEMCKSRVQSDLELIRAIKGSSDGD